MGFAMEMRELLEGRMASAVKDEVTMIMKVVEADYQLRRQKAKCWNGIGSIPMPILQGYVVDLQNGSLCVYFENWYPTQLAELNRVDFGLLQKRLLARGWCQDNSGRLWLT